MWLEEHCPDLMAQARRFLLLPDYFALRLTGRAVTDPATAASTGLYAQDATDYCALALAAAGVSRGALADIQKPGQPIGAVQDGRAEEWGLDAGAVVVTGTNDQYAGALGAGNCHPGIVSVTTGTCLDLVTLANQLPQPMPAGLLGGRFVLPQYQYVEAFAKTAGVVLEWFNRELCPGQSLHALDEMASQVPIGSRGLTVLPHFDGMISPLPVPGARGAFVNLSLCHTAADIYRAILESLGYTLDEHLGIFQRLGLEIHAVRAIGGAAKSDFWLQMMADIAGLPIERPSITEAAVLGAAMIAAVGVGALPSLAKGSEAFFRRERVFAPREENHRAYAKFRQNYVGLYRHLYGGRA
jgi:xylulokinase